MKLFHVKDLNIKILFSICAYGTVLCLYILFPTFNYAADMDGLFKACAKIDNDNERLKCFDDLTGRKIPVDKTTVSGTADKPELKAAGVLEPVKLAGNGKEKPSTLSRQWDLDPESRKDPFVIRLYRPNYMLPVAHNSSPNSDTALDYDRDAKAQNTEAKFQISFKVKLWENILGKNMDLWFAYTQLSLWQVYNKTFSSPFRESNYEPELLLNFRTDYNLFNILRTRIINVGINHQSNGRGQTLSRSWNRIVASAGFERGNFELLLRGWYRLPESRHEDDNPEIMKYMGYGELWGTYYWKNYRFSAMVRNNLRKDNKGAIQLDWSFPFPFIKNDRFSGYIQYFNGYGESLLDYDKSINRIGIGLMLMDWN